MGHSADGQDADDIGVNTSQEPPIADIIDARLSRRTLLKGMVAAGVGSLFGCATPQNVGSGSSALTFKEIARFLDETHHAAPGYATQVLIRWGDPLHAGAPDYRPGQQTAEEQELQFGFNNDYVAFMPLPRGSESSTRGLLCVNHEYAIAHLMWPGMTRQNSAKLLTREQCEVEMAAVGHSIVEITCRAASWNVVSDSPYKRRISARSTMMQVSGPAAGHPRMSTRTDVSGARVIGTQSNCAGGVTPWGTILTTEENFDYSFTGNANLGREAAAWKRYGINGRGVWGKYFDRFNLNKEPNEPNRFGWIVEIDPYDAKSTPVKRTALGRFKHECATTAVSHDGRVAVYSGDDERMEYVYKFVTRDRYNANDHAANRDLLDYGTLYVAKFETDGKMRWLPLVFGQGPLTKANGFNDQGDVMIEARRAADLLGATPMDRPEDVEAHPGTGRVYVVLTFNERRTPEQINVANPRGPNRHGHIIEIVPPLVNGRPDHTATECAWEFFILGGDPKNPEHGARYGNASSAVTDNSWIAAPDNVAFDPKGRLWITTDGQDDAAGFADMAYAAEVSGPLRGVTRGFFAAPRGAEICGPAFTPDGRTLFLAIQHPGDEKGSTYDKPSTRWPDFRADMPPRSAVVAIIKNDGGDIGS